MSRNIFEGLQSGQNAFPSAPSPGAEAPPPYSTLPAGQAAAGDAGIVWNTPTSLPTVGYNPIGMKMAYMDFVPRLVRKKLIGKNEYETFSTLIQRANNWLEEHIDLQLISCETISWFGLSHKEIFSDSSVFRKLSGTTTFMRGLRIWYLTKVIPSPSRGQRNTQVLHCVTFPARQSETFAQLLSRVNERLKDTTCSGKIISIETVRSYLEEGSINTECTFWKEDTSDTKHVVFSFRVYIVLTEMQGHETIGYQDFLPAKTNRSKENRGYEVYSDLMDRSARWIARQQGVRFTNIQTIPIKIKKSTLAFEERCTFTEHGRRVTNYLNVVRAYFVIQQGTSTRVEHQPARLTFRTFIPAQINVATTNNPVKFEDIRTLLDRINHWLQITGANIFSIETFCGRLPMSSTQVLGPEATFVPSQDGGTHAGKFIFHIRIYLNGDYIEPPAAINLLSTPSMTYLY